MKAVSPRRTLTALVSVAQFAEFVRSGAYFDEKLWEPRSPSLPVGADEVLRRIRFRWSERHKPVTNVTWLEAAAYCRYKNGALPQSADAERARAAEGKRDIVEWCAQWYSAVSDGPGVRPEPPPRRRVVGLTPPCADPLWFGATLGFRVELTERPAGGY